MHSIVLFLGKVDFFDIETTHFVDQALARALRCMTATAHRD